MKPSTSHATIIILAGAALVLSALLGTAFYRLDAEKRSTDALLEEAGQKAAEQEAFQSLRSLQMTAKADLDAFDQTVFSEEKLVTTIDTLEKAGSALGAKVEIVSVDKAQGEKKGTSPGLRLVVEAAGPWRSVYQFLRAIEKLPYRLTIEEAELSHAAGGWRGHFTLFFPTFE